MILIGMKAKINSIIAMHQPQAIDIASYVKLGRCAFKTSSEAAASERIEKFLCVMRRASWLVMWRRRSIKIQPVQLS